MRRERMTAGVAAGDEPKLMSAAERIAQRRAGGDAPATKGAVAHTLAAKESALAKAKEKQAARRRQLTEASR